MKINAILFCLFAMTAFTSCKKTKEETTPAPTAHTVTLQPGSEGQDSYVSKLDNNSSDGNSNLNNLNELIITKWSSMYGGTATQRAYIKFTGLKDIPSNATVTSAKLYLYGKSSSISSPQGNSSYPGSTNGENSSLIQRVTGGDWDESTLTWNTMPSSTDAGQAVILASTTQWNYNATVDVTTMVKEMILNPAQNFGFVIKLSNESIYRSLVFSSSEASDPSVRPKLVVEATY